MPSLNSRYTCKALPTVELADKGGRMYRFCFRCAIIHSRFRYSRSLSNLSSRDILTFTQPFIPLSYSFSSDVAFPLKALMPPCLSPTARTPLLWQLVKVLRLFIVIVLLHSVLGKNKVREDVNKLRGPAAKRLYPNISTNLPLPPPHVLSLSILAGQ